MIKSIEKKNIGKLLKDIVNTWKVYVPQINMDSDVLIDALPHTGKELDEALKNIVLEGGDTVISPKDIFFPQLETMFEFERNHIHETLESSPVFLFGVKPCDLKAMHFCDDFYLRNIKDTYYLNRIQNRFIVTVGCITPPRATCFCTSAGTGPFAVDGFDLQFVDNSDSYLVETGSEKGEDFIELYKYYFNDFPGDAEKLTNEIISKAADSVELVVEFKKALKLMEQDDFVPEELYRRIGERCIYCGGCLYVCPTCTCFNVFDNTSESGGERMRNWDACVFEGYTRETSGHNPRKEKWLRTSRRYEHKLKYDYKMTGMSGCIGCGRCLSSCPVEIGISKFIQEITENKRLI